MLDARPPAAHSTRAGWGEVGRGLGARGGGGADNNEGTQRVHYNNRAVAWQPPATRKTTAASTIAKERAARQ